MNCDCNHQGSSGSMESQGNYLDWNLLKNTQDCKSYVYLYQKIDGKPMKIKVVLTEGLVELAKPKGTNVIFGAVMKLTGWNHTTHKPICEHTPSGKKI